ncbi:MAG: hypothetical protein LIP03_15815 [Bacteroidales bacterium]|nr:hypothetical protein [Bacteroidales bacterium]
MKKLGIYLLPLLALGLVTSCEEDPFKGIAQENAQEPLLTIDGVQVAEGSGISGSALDLNNYVDQTIPVISVTEAENLPEDASVSFEMQVASDSNFSDAQTLQVTDGAVSANDWSNAFRTILGNSPKAKTNYVRFLAYVNQGDTEVRLGSMDTYLCEKSLTVTPIDLGLTIESAYYLIGTCNGWNGDDLAAWQFSHSDKDVYDDPNFYIEVEITQDQIDANSGWWWKIVPQSNIDAGNVWQLGILGVVNNGDTSLSGYLTATPKEGASEVGAGCIMEAGKYKMTINMEDGSYEFTASGQLYAIGDGCNWSFDNAPKIMRFDNKFGEFEAEYAGFAYIVSQVKFTDAPDWNHGNYGMGTNDLGVDVPGTLADGSNTNLPVDDGEGTYFCAVNITNLTYELTRVNQVGMIGDFNSWAGDEDMTPNEDYTIWTGTLTLSDAGGWKFRMNGGWDINLGGDTSNLTFNGDNINSAAGTYTVTLDLTTAPYTCTIQ